MSEATSAYVFPFRPFRNLDRTEFLARISDPRTVTLADLAPMLDRLAPEIVVPSGASWEERLIKLFADSAVVFGRPEWITDLANHWIGMARPFVEAGRPIEFTILGFPYKAPVPLKTRRILPDFGELVMLKRLHELARAVGVIHAPGARIHVFAEGAFAKTSGKPQADSDAYFAALDEMVAAAGYGATLVLHETAGIAERTPGFSEVWQETAADIKARAAAGDEKTVRALRDSLPVTFHLLSVLDHPEDLVRRAYLGDPSAAALRAELDARAAEGVILYRAFLEARDRVKLLEQFAPGALGMTVSPRPGRLGVRPLPVPATALPYHGIPVWDPVANSLQVEYRWDLLTDAGAYERWQLDSDPDAEPFLLIRRSNPS